MQLRYSFRLDPTPGQVRDLARAFGCARWVYNEALRLRKLSYEAGDGWIPGAALSKRLITEAKKDPNTDTGRLSLPKIGEVAVRWSRPLPAEPSSVTVIRDASGRFFASFVVVSDPAQDLARFPEVESETGIDLGLTHFAVLADGTKIDALKLPRRAERKLKKAQQALARKQKGSNNRKKTVTCAWQGSRGRGWRSPCTTRAGRNS